MSGNAIKRDHATTRKLDNLSENLEDLSYAADKLKDELGETPNQTLDELRSDLETARDLVDDIVASHD